MKQKKTKSLNLTKKELKALLKFLYYEIDVLKFLHYEIDVEGETPSIIFEKVYKKYTTYTDKKIDEQVKITAGAFKKLNKQLKDIEEKEFLKKHKIIKLV